MYEGTTNRPEEKTHIFIKLREQIINWKVIEFIFELAHREYYENK